MTRSVRLEATAVAPGQVEQMMVKLEEPSIITGVKLDEPDSFEVVRVIAGRAKGEGAENLNLKISPPNAFVIVLVKSKLTEGEVRICSGDLLLSGEAQPVTPQPVSAQPVSAQPVAAQPLSPRVVSSPIPVARELPPPPPPPGSVTLKTDARGWPQGGMNEVWVLMNRGEAERMVQAINGYPIQPAERPALLRRFGQALGTVK